MDLDEFIDRLERLQGIEKYAGSERRKFSRLVYPPHKRPMLKIGNYQVEVVDISESGMKLFNYKQHRLGQDVQGTVEFTSGMTVEVSGKIVWQYKNELGIFMIRIPKLIIEEETDSLLRHYLEEKSQR